MSTQKANHKLDQSEQRQKRRRRRQGRSLNNAPLNEANFDIYSAIMANRLARSHQKRLAQEKELRVFISCLVGIDRAVGQGLFQCTKKSLLAPRFCKRLQEKGYNIKVVTDAGKEPYFCVSWNEKSFQSS